MIVSYCICAIYEAIVLQIRQNGYTPLHVAVEHDRLKLVRRMLNHSIPAGVAGSKGLTPVHVAAEKNRLEILKLLKSNGADLTVKSLVCTVTQCHCNFA